MTPRNVKRIILVTLAVVLLGISVQYGFGTAWQSQYTFAIAPAAKSKQPPAPAPKTAKPPAVQEPNTVMTPKPQSLSNRVVEYHINVSLREDARHLDGEQTVTWINPGKKTVSELYFHLYPNAFQSDKTTFMMESGGQLRQDKATSASQGHMQLNALQTLEGESLLPRLQYVQPDDGNENDFTLAKLRLPEPLEPGKSVTLRMSYEVKLPEVFARMGYSGSFVMAGQWFPKVAVYETAGTRGRTSEGWNVHQYHGNSEFYSDFGIYSVRIQVPEAYTVAATGFQTKPIEVKNEAKVYQFYADDVHDFAWAASPDFVYEEAAYSDTGIPGVRIKLYLDPSHAALKDRYMHAAKSALSNYAKWYGQYPYTTLSIVVPPKGAGGAGGMEYPTLVTAFSAEKPNPGYDLERTVVHEIGHQYWYGMVASNEFEEAWLDEGFTSYAEDKVMEAAYGLTPNLRLEASYMTDPAPLKQPSWAYGSHTQYAENVYMRAKLVLVGIENQVGTRTMQKILRTYFQKYKFKHPSTADFQRVVEQVTKTKWHDYFSQYVYDDQMADFSVEAIHVRPVKEDGKPMYESVVLIKRNGGTNGEIPIVMQFTDGTRVTKNWAAGETHIQYKQVHDAPLEWAVVDPNHTNVLDNKVINNFMQAQLPESSRARWSLGAAKLIEGLLGSLSW
ncbi:M1 family metallopeptidase [Paenibacillus arenilitoris]|uniref:M1 family metallopeptidase n=1 Tax=Paenibacillus arenilitoris TaxID=2772299 RepID=A0A927CTK8_9BACL|nr:M1 family metallopeptidase [Paenibacillus arenilitoris]MBD2871631.1 M1 family metallopeptidase [Paenibacillus arenilitoris]